MSIQRRLADNLETMWTNFNVNDVAVWRCNSKSDRDNVVDKLCRSFSGLHTHLENNHMVFQKREVPVYKIPENLTDLEDIAKYADLYCTRPISKALGSIAIAEDAVAVVGVHCVFDGGSLKYFNDLICQDKEIPEIGINPGAYEPFREKMKNTNFYMTPVDCDEKAVRYSSRDGKYLTNVPFALSFREKMKMEDFQVFDKKDKKLHGFSESLFASQVLSVSALNGKFDKTGVWEVFGTRPYAEKNYKLTQGQYLSTFNVFADNITLNDTVKDLMTQMRKHMNYQLKRGAPWASLNTYATNYSEGKVQDGCFTVLSSLGEFKIGGPVKDFLFHSTANSSYCSLNLFSYNVKSSKDNIYNLVHTHTSNFFSFRESKAFLKGVKYAATKIDLNSKIGDALNEVIDYQKQVMKKNNTIAKIVKF